MTSGPDAPLPRQTHDPGPDPSALAQGLGPENSLSREFTMGTRPARLDHGKRRVEPPDVAQCPAVHIYQAIV